MSMLVDQYYGNDTKCKAHVHHSYQVTLEAYIATEVTDDLYMNVKLLHKLLITLYMNLTLLMGLPMTLYMKFT